MTRKEGSSQKCKENKWHLDNDFFLTLPECFLRKYSQLDYFPSCKKLLENKVHNLYFWHIKQYIYLIVDLSVSMKFTSKNCSIYDHKEK